jgi:hypothetical protein
MIAFTLLLVFTFMSSGSLIYSQRSAEDSDYQEGQHPDYAGSEGEINEGKS